MSNSSNKKLSIIQSRGLGDIVIALPIANYYKNQGYDIYWPICDNFVSHFKDIASWVNWIPVPVDSGAFFYNTPMKLLEQYNCDENIVLYQALTGHKFHEVPYFQHTKFDQYKYIVSGVPFLEKWKLAECITRNQEREQALYNKLVTNDNYVVIHLEGSDHRASFDTSIIPSDWQIIEIDEQSDCIFDWLTILEKAQSLVMVDSVFSNLVDQLNIGDDRYFIPRSHIGLTPVLGQHWTWLEK